MVTDKLLDEVKEKIKAGIDEGVIKNNLLLEGYGLSEITEALDIIVRGQQPVKNTQSKKGGVLQAIGLTILGLVLALGGAIALLKITNRPINLPFNIPWLSSPTNVATESANIELTPTLPPNVVPLETPDIMGPEYKNVKEGYRISPPKDWTVDTSGKLGAPVFFFAPEASTEGNLTYKANINVMTGPANNFAVDGYTQLYLANLKTDLENFTVTEQRTITVSGRPMEVIRGSFTRGGIKFRDMLLIAVVNDKVYVTTGLALDSNYSQVQGQMDLSIYSFNIL